MIARISKCLLFIMLQDSCKIIFKSVFSQILDSLAKLHFQCENNYIKLLKCEEVFKHMRWILFEKVLTFDIRIVIVITEYGVGDFRELFR